MPGFIRHLVPLALVLAHLLAFVPAASAQDVPRLSVTFNPTRITTQHVGGCAPNTNCPLVRGVTYTVPVTFTVQGADAESMVVQLEPGGLELEPSIDTTNPMPAGSSATFTVDVTLPESGTRRDRNFYFGRIKFFGEQGTFILPISVSVPSAKITWGQLINPATGDKASAITQVGSGSTVIRRINLNSNLDVEDFELRTNAPDRVELTNVPDTLPAAQNQEITIEYTAPIVNRRTRQDVVLSPGSGLEALRNTLRLRLVILPVQLTWSPPFVRRTLDLSDRHAVPVTVTATSNYTVSRVSFRTADLGLTPLTSHDPGEEVTLQAGVPHPVSFLVCPGYAPTQYFLGISAFQDKTKPLNKRLQIRSNVIDPDGDGLTPDAPDCILP